VIDSSAAETDESMDWNGLYRDDKPACTEIGQKRSIPQKWVRKSATYGAA